MHDVIIIGNGDNAEVVIDIISEIHDINIIGIASENLNKGDQFMGFPVLGNDQDIISSTDNSVQLVNAVGAYRNTEKRQGTFDKFKQAGFTFISVLHPNVSISSNATIGEGVIMYSGVSINTNTTIGNNCILALNCSVGHHTHIEDHVLISAGVNVGANATVGANSLVAIGASVISGVSISKNNLIGAGAVVVKNTSENQILFGVPAKPINEK